MCFCILYFVLCGLFLGYVVMVVELLIVFMLFMLLMQLVEGLGGVVYCYVSVYQWYFGEGVCEYWVFIFE